MVLKSFFSAFLMYSRIPVPNVEWKEENRRYALCFFPFIGAVIGFFLFFWHWICKSFGFGILLRSAVDCCIPIWITGGIHMDGFCDVIDAKASCQTREKKLSIMSDPHIGSFALFSAILYVLLQFALFSELKTNAAWMISALGFVQSRALSGLAAVTFQCAKKKGSLNDFSCPAQKKVTKIVLALIWGSTGIFMLFLNFWSGVAVCFAGIIVFFLYQRFSYREFGGITGDLEGYFLQIYEILVLVVTVLVEKMI